MGNITETLDKLADGQVSIHTITKNLVDRQIDSYEILGMLIQLTDQLEQAVGPNPNSQKFDAIKDRILASQIAAEEDMERIEAVVNAAAIDKARLAGMAETPFDQPPAPGGGEN